MENKNIAPWIAYVGPFLFPWGEPGSRRVYGITRSLAAAGYRVVVASGDHHPENEVSLSEDGFIGQCTYIGLGERPERSSSVFDRAYQVLWGWGRNTVRWLDSLESKPKYVILYGGSIQYALRLKRWCRRNQVKLIVDVVEWYNPCHEIGGRFGPISIGNKLAFHHVYPKLDGVIAISSLLERNFMEQGCKVIKIPPTIDIDNFPIIALNNKYLNEISLIYIGTPGKKDLLKNIVDGVLVANVCQGKDGVKFVLGILGPNIDDVKHMVGAIDLPDCIVPFGRVDQYKVAEYLQRADFGVLLREPVRSSNAGFPTKFVESMANGVPMISNLTSDIGNYLEDGVNGFVCDGCSAEALGAVLLRVAQYSIFERHKMRENARNLAANAFDFKLFAAPVSEFIKNL